MMKFKTLFASAITAATLLLSGEAMAAQGYAVTSVNLRAGPGIDYPVVDRLRGGRVVEIYGCMDDWGWCEVGIGYDRGWVSGDYLEALYHERRVRIVEAAPVIHVPVIQFNLGTYWNEHYRDRPFYRDREKWAHRDYGRRTVIIHNNYHSKGGHDRRDDDHGKRGKHDRH